MPGFMKRTMSYLGMSDVVPEDEDEFVEEEESESSFDSDRSVTPIPSTAPAAAPTSRKTAAPFQGRVSRNTTIQPNSYEAPQMVGRVVFGVAGSIERVTPRVFLLSPARVDIVAEEPEQSAARDLFSE